MDKTRTTYYLTPSHPVWPHIVIFDWYGKEIRHSTILSYDGLTQTTLAYMTDMQGERIPKGDEFLTESIFQCTLRFKTQEVKPLIKEAMQQYSRTHK